MCATISRRDEIPSEGKIVVLCVSEKDWFGMFLKPIFENFVEQFTTLDARSVIITSEEAKDFRTAYPPLTSKPYLLFFHNGWCYAERRDLDKMTMIEFITDFVKELENLKRGGVVQIQW